MNLKVFKIRKNAKLPTRAYQTDAGMDLYYCPDGARAKVLEEEGLVISVRESVLVPTGIKVNVPCGFMLEVKNKSGIAFKKQLLVGACVIDPGYTGEVYVNLHNVGFQTQYLRPGDKVAQAVLVPIIHCGIEEVPEHKLDASTERGDGGFGSTGNK